MNIKPIADIVVHSSAFRHWLMLIPIKTAMTISLKEMMSRLPAKRREQIKKAAARLIRKENRQRKKKEQQGG